LFGAGVTTAVTPALIEMGPPHERPTRVAVYNTLAGIAAVTLPLLGTLAVYRHRHPRRPVAGCGAAAGWSGNVRQHARLARRRSVAVATQGHAVPYPAPRWRGLYLQDGAYTNGNT